MNGQEDDELVRQAREAPDGDSRAFEELVRRHQSHVVTNCRYMTRSGHEGEHLFATERLVVSPSVGVFAPVEQELTGTIIEAGRLLGHVSGHEVRSPFAGEIQGFLAVEGERVTASQPIAWLRTS